jgi:hypothetical protein
MFERKDSRVRLPVTQEQAKQTFETKVVEVVPAWR